MFNGWRLRGTQWQPARAAELAVEVLDELAEESQAPQLQNFRIDDLTHIVLFPGDELPDIVQSPGANFDLVCQGEYPDPPPEDHPVTLQAKSDPDNGNQLSVFLSGDCLPSRRERREIVTSGRLRFLQPRRSEQAFLDREEKVMLQTDWLQDEEDFRNAMREAVEIFILTSRS